MAELESPETRDRSVRRAAFWFTVVAVVCAVVVNGGTIVLVAYEFPYWADILKDHFAAIIGLPGAAAVSFVLVVFLRQTDGPIEFEGSDSNSRARQGRYFYGPFAFS